MNISFDLSIAQIVVSILIIAAILLQQRGASLGSAFGGSGAGFYSARRGLEKKLYWATIILAVVFIALAIVHLAY